MYVLLGRNYRYYHQICREKYATKNSNKSLISSLVDWWEPVSIINCLFFLFFDRIQILIVIININAVFCTYFNIWSRRNFGHLNFASTSINLLSYMCCIILIHRFDHRDIILVLIIFLFSLVILGWRVIAQPSGSKCIYQNCS